jgi:hypothetical protein
MATDRTDGNDPNRAWQALQRLLTRAEAAEYLAVSPATLSRWAHLRCGPRFVKMTDAPKGGVRYAVADLDAFIKSATRSTSGPTD